MRYTIKVKLSIGFGLVLALVFIQATRAAEGFDDGFDEAERYAQQFRQHIQEFAAIFPDKRVILDELSASFEALYREGKEMAQQYVERGPKAGNAAMEGFDAYAEDMDSRIEALVPGVTRLRVHYEPLKR